MTVKPGGRGRIRGRPIDIVGRRSERDWLRVETAPALPMEHYRQAIALAGLRCMAARARGYIEGSTSSPLLSSLDVLPPPKDDESEPGRPGRPARPSTVPR